MLIILYIDPQPTPRRPARFLGIQSLCNAVLHTTINRYVTVNAPTENTVTNVTVDDSNQREMQQQQSSQ
jgi:hypothetical protein